MKAADAPGAEAEVSARLRSVKAYLYFHSSDDNYNQYFLHFYTKAQTSTVLPRLQKLNQRVIDGISYC